MAALMEELSEDDVNIFIEPSEEDLSKQDSAGEDAGGLLDHLKRFLDHFLPTKNLSHDETMMEYYGKHGCKQCIRNKPQF